MASFTLSGDGQQQAFAAQEAVWVSPTTLGLTVLFSLPNVNPASQITQAVRIEAPLCSLTISTISAIESSCTAWMSPSGSCGGAGKCYIRKYDRGKAPHRCQDCLSSGLTAFRRNPHAKENQTAPSPDCRTGLLNALDCAQPTFRSASSSGVQAARMNSATAVAFAPGRPRSAAAMQQRSRLGSSAAAERRICAEAPRNSHR